ncbi:MAG: PAS domain S-box protein, partial [Bacteroidota bacterium]
MKYLHPSKLWSIGVFNFLPLLLVIVLFQYQSHQAHHQNQLLTEKIFANKHIARLLVKIEKDARAMESFSRAYRLTSHEKFRTDFFKEADCLDNTLDTLQAALTNTSDLQDDFQKLEKIAAEKIALAKKRISEPNTEALPLALTLKSDSLMDSLELITHRMSAILERQLSSDLVKSQKLSRQAARLGDFSTALAVLLCLLGLFLWIRQVAAKEKMQTEIEDLYHNAPVGYHAINADTLIVAMNKTQLDWLGYTAEEVIGKMKYTDLLDPVEWEEKLKTLPQYLENGQVKNMEYRLRKKSGEWLPVLLSSKAVFDQNGNLIQSLATVSDISERKKLIEDLYEHAPVGYHSTNTKSIITEINQTELDWLGYSREEVIGKMTPFDLMDEDSKAVAKNYATLFYQKGDIREVRLNFKKKSGETLPVVISGNAVYDSNGNYLGARSVVMDYSEQKQIRDDLYENAPVGYHSLNSEGIFLAMNQTELDWLGYTAEEVIGKMCIAELLTESEQVIFRSKFPDFFEPGKTIELRLEYRKKSGEWLPVLMRGTAAFDENGNFVRTRSTVFDMTDRKKLEEQIAEARAAERTAQLKEQFMANMSHEIRTPLTAIIGFAQLLGRAPLMPNQQKQVQAIETSSEALLTLVDDILDFSKIEAGMLRIEAVPFSLPELLHSVEEMFRQRAEKKNLDLVFELDENAPHLLLGDPVRLTQVLANLLSNAMKFTEKGGINVSTKILEESPEGYLVQFSIADTGIGIPVEKQEEIFERFRQASNETTRRFGGSGLGLSIVKRLVELQEGNIRVESELGSGSTFIVTLRYAKPTHVPVEFEIASGKPLLRQVDEPNLRILVAEDNPMNQRLVEEIFTAWGIDFQIVPTGNQAVDAVRDDSFDLVMMDIQMPEMDGYQAAQIIRHELNSQVPILAMTAHAFFGEREKCLALGMNDYISKPFRIEDLQRHISNLLAQNQVDALPPANDTVTEKLLQFSYLNEVSGGKKEFLKEMGEIFLRQLPRELATLHQATT